MDQLRTKLIQLAIEEDIGNGDHSSLSCLTPSNKAKSVLLVKEPSIIAGISVAKEICNLISSEFSFEVYKKDGEKLLKNDIAFSLEGPAIKLLQAERLVLNFMQRMSGIATKTNELVESVKHTNVKLLDTRKTTPGFRVFEKEAVRIGGGFNHRFGLFDMIMLKDNHVDLSGGVTNAIRKAVDYKREKCLDIGIEVEVRTLKEVEEVLKFGYIQRIMFDNFNAESVAEAVRMVNGTIETEASGGINERNLIEYAETGVDFISIGAITHHVKSTDLSLKVKIDHRI